MSVTFKLADGQKPKFLVVSVTPCENDALEPGLYLTLIIRGPFETSEQAKAELEKYFEGVSLNMTKKLN